VPKTTTSAKLTPHIASPTTEPRHSELSVLVCFL